MALTLGFPCRNVAFGLTVATTILQRPDYLAILLVYFLVEVPVVLGGTVMARREGGVSDAQGAKQGT